MKRFSLVPLVLLLGGCIVVPSEPARRNSWPAPVVQAAPAPAPATIVTVPPGPPPPPPTVVMEMPPPLDEPQIIVVYQEVLDRRPSDRELWEWRERSHRQRISPDEVRRALHDSNEFRQDVPDRVIRRAFLDYHRTEPNAEELRLYRRRIIDEGWSVDRVRQDISRRTVEAAAPAPQRDNRSAGDRDDRRGPGRDNDEPRRPAPRDRDRDGRSFDAILNRAYSDVLERKPDPAGRAHYLRMLEEGAPEEQIRGALRQSEEFRVTLPDSKTRRAYQEVLHRAPDEGGLQHYRKLIVDKGWTENDVKNDLRKSAEYRNQKR